MSEKYIWTSEYVSPGHPDKIADQISDTVVDYYIGFDPDAKVACETLVKGNDIIVAGEISSNAPIPSEDMETWIRNTIRDIGYESDEFHFNANSVNIGFLLSQQSSEINNAVATDEGTTAGDQGIMFGYATRETPSMMPLAIYLAKGLIQTAYDDDFRTSHGLHPDMKSQVSIEYEGHVAQRVSSVVMSICHSPNISLEDLRRMFKVEILPEFLSNQPDDIVRLFDDNTVYHINPAGAWNVGGPVSDCGLTGRKIVVDQYGADCQIGGGAFSGKDPSKVDRSAAYMARHIAVTLLTANPDANAIKVQLSYAIGEKYPVSVRAYDPTTNIEYDVFASFTRDELTPDGIINHLGLKLPVYGNLAKNGHVGNTIQTPVWDKPRVNDGIPFDKLNRPKILI